MGGGTHNNKCRSETAGELASLMHAFLASAIEYPGRAGHITKVVAYLQRTSRLKYRRVDIERVVEFLGLVEGKDRLLEKMVKLGVKQHPQSVLLNFRAGLIEPARGLLQFGSVRSAKLLGDSKEAGGKFERSARNGVVAGDPERLDPAQRDGHGANGVPVIRRRTVALSIPPRARSIL